MDSLFVDRTDAGKQLANALKSYSGQSDIIILALPRGGVPVAYPIAKALKSPLDVFLVRKLGVPRQEELAMGAIASNNVMILNDEIINQLGISQSQIDEVIKKEKSVLEERQNKYTGDRAPIEIENKTVILVDDGIATGSTIRAAIKAIKKLNCKKIVVAVPVAPPDTIEKIRDEVDEMICLKMPYPFFAIGGWYENFGQTSDEEVITLLQKSRENSHD